MITITGTSFITIQGLGFALPVFRASGLIGAIGATGAFAADLAVGIGIDNSTSIVIEDCTLLLPSPEAIPNEVLIYVAAGIFAAENCSGLRVLRNRFECTGGGVIDNEVYRYIVGLWMSPTSIKTLGSTATGTIGTNPDLSRAQAGTQAAGTQPKAKSKAARVNLTQAAAGFVNLPYVNDQLDDVEITDNRFTGLSLAVFVTAELGMIRCTNNRATNCCGGYWFVESDLGGNTSFGQAALNDEQQGNNLASAYTARSFMQPVLLANAVNFSASLRPTAAAAKRPPAPAVSDDTRGVLLTDSGTHGQTAYTSFLTGAAKTNPDQPKKGQHPPQPPRPAPQRQQADYANASAAYTALQSVGIARELNGTTLTPALYIRDNEAVLVPYDLTVKTPASLQGIRLRALPQHRQRRALRLRQPRRGPQRLLHCIQRRVGRQRRRLRQSLQPARPAR